MKVYIEPRDLWVGVYWEWLLTARGPRRVFYVCLLPTVVIRFTWPW